MKKTIYFNVHVSNYFNVPFSNKGRSVSLETDNILNCPIVSWDIDTKKTLEEMQGQILDLIGEGDGLWSIKTLPKQGKPDTERWNNPAPEQEQKREIGLMGISSFLFI